ncbi:MAG TPA: DUF2723 domain-containing protein [Verrucomicrobiae bacterium]|nr:DUF2723 domain-containing protein [Verrucomicrobiae bacterium]
MLLAVYLWTLAPDVTLENSGMMATGATYGGIINPPGYPLWTIYSWLFTHLLPFSTIAWRVGVGSGVAATLAGGLVALMVSRGGKLLLENSPGFARRSLADQNLMRIVCGCVAGLALGFSVPVWQKAVIVDIWTFGELVFGIMLCLLMRWMAEPNARKYLYRAALVYSMLVTERWEMLVLAPGLLTLVFISAPKLGRDLFFATATVTFLIWLCVKFGLPQFLSYFGLSDELKWFFAFAFAPAAVAALVFIAMKRSAGSEWKAATICMIMVFLGLGCFFYLPIASMMNPPVNWGYPRTIEGFYHCISRGQYEELHPTHNWYLFGAQLCMVAKDTSNAFGWYYLPFAVLPFCFLHKMQPAAQKWLFGPIVIFIYVGPVLIAMLNPSADKQSMELHQPYWSALYVALAMWAGLGMITLAAMTPPAWGRTKSKAAAER